MQVGRLFFVHYSAETRRHSADMRNPENMNYAATSWQPNRRDGPCAEWRTFRCHAVSGPALGDFVIVLPADEASLAEAAVYRQRGELVFSYEPRPPMPHWLHFLFSSLHIGSLRDRHETVPDRWIDGWVTIWK